MGERSSRSIPAVEKVLQALGDTALPRPLVVSEVRRVLSGLRSESSVPNFKTILGQVREAITALGQSRIQPVINGTGILIHTNLGRAPLGREPLEAMSGVAVHYTNLELDLLTGNRGARAAYVERCLALLCHAEAATVVNNCAAALVLMLRHFTVRKREVIISRGELVQIGGGFRIPEILEASGARLREVGTTNKTSLSDYEKAIGPDTALILRVHRSNFFMGGFVEAPATAELVALAKRNGLPIVEDLGSGAVVRTDAFPPLEHEPTPSEILRQGVNLVCFSGDKLFGGPQAGIIAGQARRVRALKREPFYRALRCDKLVLSGLQSVAETYLRAGYGSSGRPGKRMAPVAGLPILDLLQSDEGTLQARAQTIQHALAGWPLEIRIGQGHGQAGGGTLPRSSFPSVTLGLIPKSFSVSDLSHRLRTGQPPVVGYVSGKQFTLDLRTVFPHQDTLLIMALQTAFG